MHKSIKEFNEERQRLNDLVLKDANKTIKRFFSLDGQTYREGALDIKTKEMLGLVSSLVLRCDDCIKYHLENCYKAKVSTAELNEVFSVGMVVGGSITIPHIRRAVEYWNNLQEGE